jgi:outer membrane beta-barrel protein
MCARLFRSEILAAVLALAALSAHAEEVIYGPDGAPTVVQRKLHTMTGRLEVGAAFDISMNTALIDQYGALLTATYHPNEWLDVGPEVVFNRTKLSMLARNVRADLRARTPTPRDEFANDNQLRFAGFFAARLAPIYGKFNLASELPVHFQAFLLAGAGAGSVHRESINLCQDPGTDACNPDRYQASDAVKGIGEVGGGFRFYFGQRWSLRTEVRAYLFPSSYKTGNDLMQPSSGNAHRYLAGIVTFAGGLSLLF